MQIVSLKTCRRGLWLSMRFTLVLTLDPILQFTQAKSDSEIRWAVLNVMAILRAHKKTLTRLASAMAEGQSIGKCIAVIEETAAPALAK